VLTDDEYFNDPRVTNLAEELTRTQVRFFEMQARVAQLEAELTVVAFERDQLKAERDAVRVYFGGTKVGTVLEQQADPANLTGRVMTLEEAADEIFARYPDKKIQAIKELRSAWPDDPSDPHRPFGLKEAKDAIDAAQERYRRGNGMSLSKDMFGSYIQRNP
jgi:ribosomal protein L7/L12